MLDQVKYSFSTTVGVLSAALLFYPIYHIGSYTCKRMFKREVKEEKCNCETLESL